MKLTELSVGYPRKGTDYLLFENLNLSLQPGELICFMGPNGIGKSTLLKTLAGLQNPLKGTITHLPEKNIALVLTERITALNMTVKELVTFGRYPYLDWNILLSSNDQEIIQRAMEQVGIESISHKNSAELSDGQMQLVMIARALAQDTPIILLDEPTAHLDLTNRVEIINLLRSIAHQMKKSILITTHELDLALQTADLIWLGMPNKKIKVGIPEDLVLDGSFDAIFQCKGFDLKTGEIAQKVHRTLSIKLLGEGLAYRWTKNALRRCGYAISEKATQQITINTHHSQHTYWEINGKKFNSLNDVLIELSCL